MTYELLEQEDIVKKTIYNPHEPIATVFSAVKEFLEFADITGTSYTQPQAVNIAYAILHRTGKPIACLQYRKRGFVINSFLDVS